MEPELKEQAEQTAPVERPDSLRDAYWQAIAMREQWLCPIVIWRMPSPEPEELCEYSALPFGETPPNATPVDQAERSWLDQVATYAIQPDDIIVAVYFRRKSWGQHAVQPTEDSLPTKTASVKQPKWSVRKVVQWSPAAS